MSCENCLQRKLYAYETICICLCGSDAVSSHLFLNIELFYFVLQPDPIPNRASSSAVAFSSTQHFNRPSSYATDYADAAYSKPFPGMLGYIFIFFPLI